MTVAQLLANVSSKELDDWMVYETIEPFTDHRQAAQAAVIAMVIANTNRKKGSTPFTIKDFIVNFEPQFVAQQSWTEQLAMLKKLFPDRKRKSTANDT